MYRTNNQHQLSVSDTHKPFFSIASVPHHSSQFRESRASQDSSTSGVAPLRVTARVPQMRVAPSGRVLRAHCRVRTCNILAPHQFTQPSCRIRTFIRTFISITARTVSAYTCPTATPNAPPHPSCRAPQGPAEVGARDEEARGRRLTACSIAIMVGLFATNPPSMYL